MSDPDFESARNMAEMYGRMKPGDGSDEVDHWPEWNLSRCYLARDAEVERLREALREAALCLAVACRFYPNEQEGVRWRAARDIARRLALSTSCEACGEDGFLVDDLCHKCTSEPGAPTRDDGGSEP